MTVYVGFAIADSMFPDSCQLQRTPCPLSLAMKLLQAPTAEAPEPVVNACNKSHAATLQAFSARYGIDLTTTLSETPPRVALQSGDVFLCLSVRGLPRLTDRHEYTPTEIETATFSFGLWKVT
jgi:hypothetical protein